jgi:hypothetical protein
MSALFKTTDPRIVALSTLPRFGGRITGRSTAANGRTEWQVSGLPADFLKRVVDDPGLSEIRAYIGNLEIVYGTIDRRGGR